MQTQLSKLIETQTVSRYQNGRLSCKCKKGTFKPTSFYQHLRSQSHRKFTGESKPKENMKITIEDSLKSNSISVTAIMYRRMKENEDRLVQDTRRSNENQVRVIEDTRRAREDTVRSKEDQGRQAQDHQRVMEDGKIFYNLRSGSAFRMA